MRPVLLIAVNYLREQRWPLLVLLGWVVISAVLSSVGRPDREDALFFIKQQAIYGVAFVGFLAASAIYNDRRSRRILAVLSKGIERRQYLGGLLCGALLVAGIYCVAMAVFGTFMLKAVGVPFVDLLHLLVLLLISCALVAVVGILFSTFTPPLIATGFTALALGLGAGLGEAGITHNMLPVLSLMGTILQYGFPSHLQLSWEIPAWGVVQVVVLWVAASWIFERRDVAVSVE